MNNPIEMYWKTRLESVKERLEENNFTVFIADKPEDAKIIVEEEILAKSDGKSISWGGSVTHVATGVYEMLKNRDDLEVLDTYDKNFTPEEALERRRQSLLSDIFVTGTNAIIEDGYLVNLDMIGNRIAALTFGPKEVIVLVGRNKIVPDLQSAMDRVKNYAAPVNAMRLDKETPCAKTGTCHDCKSPDRICNTWTITEKSFPKGRVKIILINADLGF
jgi:L-lactate utilization protein LutB